jgi:monofunctional biosynthetic peptidoglycan transglycosylase
VTASPDIRPDISRRKGFLPTLRILVRWLVIGVALLWSLAALTLLAARWIDPPSTAVHIQRRLQAWIHRTPYHERYRFIPVNQISPDLQHAVIAAEDARFYQHHGFDWHEIQIVAEDDLDGGRSRGASTITQQLIKNLFFGTGRSILRKGAEFTLVPVSEFVLGKQYRGSVPERPCGRSCRRGIAAPVYKHDEPARSILCCCTGRSFDRKPPSLPFKRLCRKPV